MYTLAAKQAVPVRLAPEVIEKARGYAESHGVSRQVVYESAILRFLADADSGAAMVLRASRPVPAEVAEAARIEREARAEIQAAHLARQAKLNEAKARATARR